MCHEMEKIYSEGMESGEKRGIETVSYTHLDVYKRQDTMIMLMKEGIQNGITLEILMTKKHKKTPEEKAAVAKQKKQQMRAKLKKETRDNLAKEEILQDDRFFFIAGYTSGGAPYGITLEEMGLKPWDDLEENKMV